METGSKAQDGVLCTYRTSMSTGRIESALAALTAERQLLEQRLQTVDEEILAEDAKLRHNSHRPKKSSSKATRPAVKRR